MSVTTDVIFCQVLQGLLVEAAWPQLHAIMRHNKLSATGKLEPPWHRAQPLWPKVFVIHTIVRLAHEPEVGIPEVISNTIDDLQQRCSLLLSAS